MVDFLDVGRTFLELAAMTAVYALLRYAHHRWARLPEEGYRASVVVAKVARRPSGAALIAGPLLPFAASPRPLSWDAIDPAGWARLFVAFLVVGASFFGATYAFNWYFGRRHLADRVVLLALGAAAVLVHPLFLAPFVVVFVVLMHQFVHPVHPADTDDLNLYCHKIVFAHQLLGVLAFIYVSAWWGNVPELRLGQLLVSLQCANYVASAAGKARLRWTTRNELVGLLAAAVAHGWFDARSPFTTKIARFVRRTNRALLVCCLALEAGAALVLVSRPLGVGMLVALAGFHVGVLALSGINFLPWLALDLALAMVLAVQPAGAFGARATLAACAAAACFVRWLRPYALAWLDAPLCTAFRFEAVAADGTVHPLPPDAFAPYDITVTNGKFRSLVDEKIAVDAWAECYDVEEYAELKRLRTRDDVKALEERIGRSYYHPVFEDRIRRFASAYGPALDAHVLSGGRGLVARDWVRPNPGWSALQRARFCAIRVRVVRVLYADSVFYWLDDRVSHTFPIAPRPTRRGAESGSGRAEAS